jgi:polyphenol oxidase
MADWVASGDFGVILRHTTTRPEGDFAITAEPVSLAARRRRVADHPWVWLRQVHGAEVITVTADNAASVTGAQADALVTADADLVLAVQTADCLAVTLHSPEGVIGVAHAGWRGLEAGTVARTIEVMRGLGASVVHRHVAPFICGACYEFGAADLDRLADRFGDRVRSTTAEGAVGLELGELLLAGLGEPFWELPDGLRHARALASCTAEDPDRWFSYRARAEAERMATVIWREPTYDAAMGS